tara:strand:- start:1643 stop:1828 length:186 start_codon:yes stop_codon:yes gene_type:complete
MKGMHAFQEIKIWQKAMKIEEKSYFISSEFPSEEKINTLLNEITDMQKMRYSFIQKFSKKI